MVASLKDPSMVVSAGRERRNGFFPPSSECFSGEQRYQGEIPAKGIK